MLPKSDNSKSTNQEIDENKFFEPLEWATELDVKPAVSFLTRNVDWLWKDRIARGKVTIFAGEGGLGKSTVLFNLAALISTGGTFPADNFTFKKGKVVIMSSEDNPHDTIVPRLTVAKADLNQVFIVQGFPAYDSNQRIVHEPVQLDRDLEKIENVLKKLGDVSAFIIDPISAYLGSYRDNDNAEIRTLISRLTDLAERYNVALILNTHLSKPSNGKASAANRVMGSSAYVNAARSVFLFSKDQDNPNIRLMVPIKNNNGNDKTGFSYEIVSESFLNPLDETIYASRVEFSSELVTITANEALDENAGGQKLKINEATDFLEDFLRHGSKSVGEILQAAEERTLSRPTIYRAKNILKVVEEKSIYSGRSKIWYLPV